MVQKHQASEEVRDEEFTMAMEEVLQEDRTLLERLAKTQQTYVQIGQGCQRNRNLCKRSSSKVLA